MSIIKVERLSKKYTIGHQKLERYVALRDVITNGAKNIGRRLLHPFLSSSGQPLAGMPNTEEFWALKDVSFEVNQGDRIGIIGRNGAGKSTLLKIISRITEPTKGRISLKGRVASLLEVGTGFHPELTGRENIYLNGAILGMSKVEIKGKFDEIVEFAEIEKFLDTPVKRYSSGMYVRLAFAVAAHLDPEILVVDEVLAVGDAQFQKKCLGKMGEASNQGRTVLFVSHNMAAVKSLCPRCIWIDRGEIVLNGETLRIVDSYLKETMNNDTLAAEMAFPSCPEKEFQVLSVRLLNEEGQITQYFDCDKPVYIHLICISRVSLPGLYGYMTLNRDGVCVLTSDTYDVLPNCLDALAPSKYRILIKIPPRTIGQGKYTVYLNFTSSSGNKGYNIDSPKYVGSFFVNDLTTQRGNKREGYFSTLLKWELNRLE